MLNREKLAKDLEAVGAPEPLVINARRGAYDEKKVLLDDLGKFKLKKIIDKVKSEEYDIKS